MARPILRTIDGACNSAGLLTRQDGNAKLAKAAPAGAGRWRVAGLSLAPFVTDGVNACTHASPACARVCLHYAGHGEGDAGPAVRVRDARARRLRSFLADPVGFLAVLVDALERHESAAIAAGERPCVRLNVLSDLPWYRFPVVRGGVAYPHVFAAFPGVRFYDYTKVPATIAATAAIPNYRAVFSLSENNDRQALGILQGGGSVAVVIRGGYAALPEAAGGLRTWGGYPATDGDAHDLRHLDPLGPLVVVLSVKGRSARRSDGGGFFRDAAGGFDPSRVATFAAIPGAIAAGQVIAQRLRQPATAAD